MKLKYRKTLFLALITLAAGGSMAIYGSMEGNWISNVIQIVVLQQLIGTAIYLSCFGVSQTRSPFN
ncbi:MAG: hypothetical protein LH631_13660 [Alkalinema sp. CAN_BIN05]|nr:hypothetical protein [Alkalinema sp. CAN_BIN05]